MYETHFGLKKRPFRALAAGTDVFVGPQTARTMAGLKKALTAPDSIVALSGPVGVGKTTLVRRSLAAVGKNQVIVTVGRMLLGHDEVLELLLGEMGAELPAGTVQRFSAFRNLLKQHAEDGHRVFFEVEDAARIGIDALSELESPLSARELLGYFKHCFRLAGNEFDVIFEQGASELLHALSDGIPRMANNLVESALASAAESKKDRVTIDMVRRVAEDEYGLESAQAAAAVAIAVTEAVEVPEPAPAEVPKVTTGSDAASIDDDENDSIPELIQDTLPDLKILAPALATHSRDAEEADLPEIPKTPAPVEQAESAGEEIPAWDREPTLAQLRPDLEMLEHAMAAAQDLEPDTDDVAEQADTSEEPPEGASAITLDKAIQEKIQEEAELLKIKDQKATQLEEPESGDSNKTETPTPEPVIEAAPVAEPPEAPAAAIEAMPTPPKKPAAPVVANPEPPEAPAMPVEPDETVPSLPILKLGDAPPEEQVPVAADASDQETGKAEEKADTELEKIAANLARAKTIDDCDDEMAETLFGGEFSAMAAQVAANAPPELSANDEIDLALEDTAAPPVPDFEGAAAVNVDLESEADGTGGSIDLASTQQRLDTVRAFNACPAGPAPEVEAVAMSHYEPPPPPPPAGNQPDSIEKQIDASITQTIKTLSVQPAPVVDDDDEGNSGFFSRFRRG